MTDSRWISMAIIAIVLLATLRLLLQQRRGARLPPPRLAALLVLQALAGGLLLLALVPPQYTAPRHALTLLTAGAAQAPAMADDASKVLALPESNARPGITRVPDLATALRQHPGTEQLTLVGDGLVARDRDTPLPALVQLSQPPAPRGWVDLQAPAITAPGAVFSVRARAQGVPDGRAELLDPAGQVVARAALDERGGARLEGVARVVGRTLFQLRLLDGSDHRVDSIPVPLQVAAPASVRMLMLAGAPGPEAKYLRRWAADAGVELQFQSSVGAGVILGDVPVALTPARLAATDVLLLDERSLAALGAAQRSAVQQALRDGLGVLVRSAGPLPDNARQTLRGWGLAVTGNGQAAALKLAGEAQAALLPARRGPRAPAAEATQWMAEADARSHLAEVPVLEQLTLRVAGAQPLLQDADGAAIGGWRASGRGRIGLLPVTDSYRAVLAGRDDRHAELWSSVVGHIARPVAAAPEVQVKTDTPWAGERVVLCGVPAGTQVRGSAEGAPEALVVDPASGSQRCAAWWPRQAGWHELMQGEVVQAVYVFDPADAAALHRQQLRDSTALRVAGGHGQMSAATQQVPGARWPWLLAFVLVAGLLWWLERRTTATDR
jgi:hypothetical protein